MENNYIKKYLKYKEKYLLLKKIGGDNATMQIPQELIGAVIGRHGSTIKQIQDDTSCKIFLNNDILSINGTLENIERAKKIINKIITDNTFITINMEIPMEAKSLIIGKSGKTIERIGQETNCKLRLNDSNLTIKGKTHDDIENAKMKINNIIHSIRDITEYIDIPYDININKLRSDLINVMNVRTEINETEKIIIIHGKRDNVDNAKKYIDELFKTNNNSDLENDTFIIHTRNKEIEKYREDLKNMANRLNCKLEIIGSDIYITGDDANRIRLQREIYKFFKYLLDNEYFNEEEYSIKIKVMDINSINLEEQYIRTKIKNIEDKMKDKDIKWALYDELDNELSILNKKLDIIARYK